VKGAPRSDQRLLSSSRGERGEGGGMKEKEKET